MSTDLATGGSCRVAALRPTSRWPGRGGLLDGLRGGGRRAVPRPLHRDPAADRRAGRAGAVPGHQQRPGEVGEARREPGHPGRAAAGRRRRDVPRPLRLERGRHLVLRSSAGTGRKAKTSTRRRGARSSIAPPDLVALGVPATRCTCGPGGAATSARTSSRCRGRRRRVWVLLSSREQTAWATGPLRGAAVPAPGAGHGRRRRPLLRRRRRCWTSQGPGASSFGWIREDRPRRGLRPAGVERGALALPGCSASCRTAPLGQEPAPELEAPAQRSHRRCGCDDRVSRYSVLYQREREPSSLERAPSRVGHAGLPAQRGRP